MPQIYCVEDDESIRELVLYALRGQGYKAQGFATAEQFYEAVKRSPPDLVLLDIMLPGEDGISILKHLRSGRDDGSIPVIMMTAKSAEYDIVRGLDLGADDYVTKPFGIMELLSRIRSVLRRSRKTSPQKSGTLAFGNISLNLDQHQAFVNEEEISLTVKEFDLLSCLLLNKNIVLTREQIMQSVWNSPVELESRTIDMHIKSLRQKLGDEGRNIHTVRGIGYCLGERKS